MKWCTQAYTELVLDPDSVWFLVHFHTSHFNMILYSES